MNLPSDSELNIGALSRLFDSTTTSYKYLWVLGILETLERSRIPLGEKELAGVSMPVREIFAEMLKKAEPPLYSFRLSFGFKDQMGEHIQKTKKDLDVKSVAYIKAEQVPGEVVDELKRYVPARTLKPFFPREAGSSDRSDKQITEISQQAYYSASPPLYRIEKDRIELHPQWAKYLWDNSAIIKDWVLYHWLKYLQARNPNAPNVVNKMADALGRGSLETQRDWWKAAIQQGAIRCIYSGEELRPGTPFALDHYIPWSFIGHNQVWNLVPVSAEANSSKSDHLPKSDCYAEAFVQMHCQAIKANEEALQKKKFRKCAEAYIADLSIYIPPAPNEETMMEAYRAVIDPMLILARHQGFASGWVYRPQ